jgi:Na+-driven multidrug efflux pump
MLSNILQSLFGTINNIYLGQMIGVDALAAVSVFFPVMFFFIAFVMGLSSGATVLIGQAWGAGEPDKVRAQAIGRGNADRLGSIVRTGLLMNLVLTGGLVALAYLFSRAIMSFFIIDAAVLELAQGLLHIVLWSSVLFGMATVFSGAMRASGTVLMPLLISIFAIAAIEVPSAIVLSRAIGIEGIWAAYPITFGAMFILQMSYYMLVWRKRAVRRLI